MILEVLISCMHQKDLAIIEKSRIITDVLMINQTEFNKQEVFHYDSRKVRIYHTTQRGLSKSRNMALEQAIGDICLLCDDDEILSDIYSEIICRAFDQLPQADIIAFDFKNKITRLSPTIQRVGRLNSLKLASYQLAFRRRRILESGVRFDPLMGAGTGNGAGEENKFLLDCLRKGLHIYYVPKTIGVVCHGPSTWFSGYDQAFFFQRGSSTRYMLGLVPAVVYGIYYLWAKRSLYCHTISTPKAAAALFCVIRENNIQKMASGGQS